MNPVTVLTFPKKIVSVISNFCAYQTAPELRNDLELCKAQIPIAHFSGMRKNRALAVDFLKLCVTDNDSLWTDNKADYLRFRDPSIISVIIVYKNLLDSI